MKPTRELTAQDVQRAGATVRPRAREPQGSSRRLRTELRPRVLLVDVDPLSRARFGRALVTSGVDVSIADSAQETLRALEESNFDAVALLTTTSDALFDVVELLESMARVSPNVAIIARSRTPEAYELFLRSFGFAHTAVFAWDAPGAAKTIKDFAEQSAAEL